MKNKTTIKTKKPSSKTGAKKKTVKKAAQPVQLKKQTVYGKLSLWLRSKLSWIWK